MSSTRFPRAVTLLLLVGLVVGVNRLWPELLPAVVVLLALYLVTAHADKAAQLVGWAPERLGAAFTTGAGGSTRLNLPQ